MLPWVAFAEGEHAVTHIYYTFEYLDYLALPFDPFTDATIHAMGARQTVRVFPEVDLMAGYRFAANSPDDASSVDQVLADGSQDFEVNTHQLELEAMFPLFFLVRGQAGYVFRWDDYTFPNSATGAAEIPRDDKAHQFALELTRDLSPRLALTGGVIGILNTSNIASFEYNRAIAWIGIRGAL